jgi:pimeloyl-ACP methyl ester carboxylesterase
MLITCASGASAGRRAAIKAQAANSPLGDAVDLLGADICAPVAALELNGALRRPIQADMPVLLISGELDPRAPPANAEAILPGLSQGRHVVFPGVSHDFGEARQAQLELAYRFLARGETEPDRTLTPRAR